MNINTKYNLLCMGLGAAATVEGIRYSVFPHDTTALEETGYQVAAFGMSLMPVGGLPLIIGGSVAGMSVVLTTQIYLNMKRKNSLEMRVTPQHTNLE